jgi:threonine dehydrogenase-like Zn-dependent dehydrogenase
MTVTTSAGETTTAPDMRAVLFPGDRQVVIDKRPVPMPGPGEALIRTRASAICRSDMGLYIGNSTIVGGEGAGTGLVVPGHEPAGEVVAVGEGTQWVKVGDRVAGYLPIGCGHCEHCRAGYFMLCPDWKCVGFDVDGGDADYHLLPERNCLLLPDEISFVGGAVMTDMIGTQYHTQKVLGVNAATTVAVFGLGPMGAAAVMIASAFGARVIAVDMLDARLDMATKLGAAEVINNGRDDARQRIRELTADRGVEIAIDCSGAPPAQNTALDVAAKRGAVAFVGESRSTQINPSDQIIRKLLTVVGGWYFPVNEWDEICRFVLQHQVPVESLVTHQFSIDDAAEAFRAFDARETEKAVFIWP